MYRGYGLGFYVLVAAISYAVRAEGAAIFLTGDLGSVTWSGPVFAPMDTTITTPFQHVVAGRGIISGDAIATNTGGTDFDLVVTNLSFIAENSPTGSTYIKLEVLQNFAIFSPGGTYTGTHGVDGSWSTGASNFIQGDAIHDFGGSNVPLPTLLYYNTFMIPTFAVSPTSASVTNTIGVYSIKAELQMNIEGDGFISLPNSYDGSATLVPEPAISSLLCLGGLVALRQRSRRPGA